MSKKKVDEGGEAPVAQEPKGTPVESGMFAEMLAAQRRRTGGQTYMADDVSASAVCIPFPSLCWMWLTGINGLPIGKMYGLAGATQSLKSTLALNIGSWGQNLGGYINLVEAEGIKISAELQRSTMGNENYYKRFSMAPVRTLEAAQAALIGVQEFYTKAESAAQCEKIRGFLTTTILDSLSGVENESSIKKMDEEGAMTSKVSQNAKLWTEFFRPYVTRMIGHPMIFLVVNHLKEAVSQGLAYGAPTKTTPGGAAQRFHSGIYFHVNRKGNAIDKRQLFYKGGQRIERPNQEVRTLNIKVDKSSFGMDGREMIVEAFFYYDEKNEQVTYFNWHATTCALLLEKQGERNLAMDNCKLEEVCDVEVSTENKRKVYSSKVLGLEGAEDYEIGEAVMANPEVLKQLKYFLHIKDYPIWSGKMPLLETEGERAEREKKEAKVKK